VEVVEVEPEEELEGPGDVAVKEERLVVALAMKEWEEALE
jgi:hypothetical protein